MTEVLFYHLETRKLHEVLPGLLARSLERGWRVVVQTQLPERVEALNSLLWTWRDDSFLPHGAAGDGDEARQPIWLTAGDDAPNDANIRFLVDGATAATLNGLDRAVYLFNGADEAERLSARAAWKAAAEAGHDVTYWRQTPEGKWEKQG
ncbi:MAG: DNA polymerase III subunit chi [Hyphomicrobiales bacterium]|nr:MAG: DNA polymerase III subunit chi [Hyphomicrobiales bacterium]